MSNGTNNDSSNFGNVTIDEWTLPQEVHTVKQLELNGTR